MVLWLKNDRFGIILFLALIFLSFVFTTADESRSASIDRKKHKNDDDKGKESSEEKTKEQRKFALPVDPSFVNTSGRSEKELEHLLEDAKELADSSVGFWHAFVASISVILVSEIGDKTFFIAAIMAMRHSRLTIFFGALSALFLMTVLSATLGWATQIIPHKLTYYISTALFAIFGLKMLKEGWSMSPTGGQEEFEEAQEEVLKREDQFEKIESESLVSNDTESGMTRRKRSTLSLLFRFVSKIYLEAFTLTFLAEWGDRSQLTTIILAARENVVGVTVGGTLGHAICTGFAVLGGRMVAQRISVRTVTLIGGVVFILFALSALILNPEET
jgi:putative Ca2+/H+ antiporter (TMEM165/GDT1 family)